MHLSGAGGSGSGGLGDSSPRGKGVRLPTFSPSKQSKGSFVGKPTPSGGSMVERRRGGSLPKISRKIMEEAGASPGRKKRKKFSTQYNTFDIEKPFVNPGHTGFSTSFYAKKFILEEDCSNSVRVPELNASLSSLKGSPSPRNFKLAATIKTLKTFYSQTPQLRPNIMPSLSP